MTELRLRDEDGRFTTSEQESAEINSMLFGMTRGGPVMSPIPTPIPPAYGAGQPVPPGGPALPVEDENTAVNRMLRTLAGVADPDSR